MVGLRDETGAAIVEFAIILPILLLLVMGIIQFGFIFNGQITLTSISREAVRNAVVGEPYTIGDISRVNLLIKDSIEIIIEDEENTTSKKATVNGDVLVFMPFLSIFTGDKVSLTSISIMRNEFI